MMPSCCHVLGINNYFESHGKRKGKERNRRGRGEGEYGGRKGKEGKRVYFLIEPSQILSRKKKKSDYNFQGSSFRN